MNISGISRWNELQTATNCATYQELFGKLTQHMHTRFAFISVEYPDFVKPPPENAAAFHCLQSEARRWTREDRLASLNMMARKSPELVLESEEDHRVTRYLDRIPDRQ